MATMHQTNLPYHRGKLNGICQVKLVELCISANEWVIHRKNVIELKDKHHNMSRRVFPSVLAKLLDLNSLSFARLRTGCRMQLQY